MFRLTNQNTNRDTWTRLALFMLVALATAAAPFSTAVGQVGEPDVKPLQSSVTTKSDLDSVTLNGGDVVDYNGFRFDFEAKDNSTWYYTVTDNQTSGRGDGLSHVLFELCRDATVVEAGFWGPTKDDLDSDSSLWGVGEDGSIVPEKPYGVKFEDEDLFNSLTDGDSLQFYFTLDKNYSEDHTVVWTKDGVGDQSGEINGPSLDCSVATPDLSIEKTDSVESVSESGSFEYSLTVSNDGDFTIDEFTISDDVPTFTTFDSASDTAGWSCSPDNSAESTCTLTAGPIAPGEELSFSFPLLVDELWEPDSETGLCPEEPDEEVENTGAVSYDGDDGDVTPGNNEDSENTPIDVSCEDNPAELTIVKATDPATADLDFGFAGTSSVAGLDSSAFASFTLTTGGDGTQSRTFDLPGGSYTVEETSLEAGWALDSVTCTVEHTLTDGVAGLSLDPGETASCTFTNRELDPGIDIVKTDSTDPVAEGGSLDYTLEYSNTGELELTDVTITETVPANTTFNSSGPDAGQWSCTGDGGPSSECTFGPFTLEPEDDNLTVNFPLTVDDDLWEPDDETGLCGDDPEPEVINKAVISGTSVNGNVDDESSESTEIDATCEDNPATLTVAKVVSEGDAGKSFSFAGSSSEDGFDSFNLTGGDSDSFTLPGGNYSVSETVPDGWDLESLSCEVAEGGTSTTTVNLEDATASVDLDPGDDVTCTFTNRQLEAGMSVVKATNGDEIRDGFCDEGTIIVGEPVSWTYEVTNTGEQPLDITSITDDHGTPGDENDDFSPGNGVPVEKRNGNDDDVLDSGETWIYEASDAAQSGEYENTVTVEAEVQGSGEQVATKADVGTIVESSDLSGYCGVQPDLAIEKTDDADPVQDGGSLVYTLAYGNQGSADATGVTITETVPTNTTFDTGASSAGQWTCEGTAAGSECTHSVNDGNILAAGASGSVQFPLTVDEVEPDPETGECPTDPPELVDNTASITDDGENGPDADLNNNQDSEDTAILVQCEPLQLTPSIKIEKSPGTQTIQSGEKATFGITVTNDGDVDLINVTVSDPRTPDCDKQIGNLASGNQDVYICELDNVTEGFTNVATVTGETEDGGDVSDEDDAEVSVLRLDEPEQQHPHPIPTMSQWALILMAGLMLMLGAIRAREWTRR